ncbi:response regulator [Ktedonobacteria bacterium brp13]|nr:response regulator [Ktedonobacteria bacterium brp13]
MENVPKILVIDDSPTERFLMADILQRAGCIVQTANDGMEGWAMLFRERPHCLFLDILLPRVNGFEICRRLRQVEVLHTLPIILVSSKNTVLDQKYGLKMGASDYLTKPFSEQQLINVLRRVLPKNLHFPLTSLSVVQEDFTWSSGMSAPAPQPLPRTGPLGPQDEEQRTPHVIRLLLSLQHGMKSGILLIRKRDDEHGFIRFSSGQIVEARVGQREGAEARNWISSWDDCFYLFKEDGNVL